MADLKTPFRYDYVGSFLRPEALKQARKNFEEGKITKEELTAVEDDCIRDLVGSQTVSSADLPGIWILCGDFRALSTERQ